MENSNNIDEPTPLLSKSAIKARLLLDKLKNSHLILASELHITQNHQLPFSQQKRRIAMEVDQLSGGRFFITDGQDLPDPDTDEFYECRLIKVIDEVCGHSSWVSLKQIEALGDLSCCFCFEPQSFAHIGPTEEDI